MVQHRSGFPANLGLTRELVAVALGALVGLHGCDAKTPGPAKPTEPSESAERTTVERTTPDEGACTSHALADTRQPCCDALHGVDAEALGKACGFPRYRGQSQDWGCTHTFAAADESDVTVRVTDRTPLSVTEAIEIHERGFTAANPVSSRGPVAGIEGAQVLEHDGVSWAFVPRGSHAVRVAWPTAACTTETLTPTLRAISQSSPTPPRLPEKAPDEPALLGEVNGTTLLDAYAERPPLTDADFTALILPFKAKRIIVILLIAAARAQTKWLPNLLAPSARYGWPDRRELAARPIFSDDQGKAFLAEFAAAVHRLPKDAVFETKPQLMHVQELVTKGEVGMWAGFRSDTPGHEIVVHLVGPPDYARIDYVGFYREPPAKPFTPTMEPPEPPRVPLVEPSAD